MKRMFSVLCIVSICIGSLNINALAKEGIDANEVIKDQVISFEEFADATGEAKEKEEIIDSLNEMQIQRAPSESVVTIRRVVTKKVQAGVTLQCAAYLVVVRDNVRNVYIQTLEVRSPYVTIAEAVSNISSSGSASVSISGTTATIHYNGEIFFDLYNSITVSAGGLVQVGTSTGNAIRYRYTVGTQFVMRP